MTKKQQGKVDAYRKASATKLRDVYTSWSNDKEKAYERCLRLKVDMDGYDFRIVHANSWQFTCGFLYKDSEGIEHLMYITKGEDDDIRLED